MFPGEEREIIRAQLLQFGIEQTYEKANDRE